MTDGSVTCRSRPPKQSAFTQIVITRPFPTTTRRGDEPQLTPFGTYTGNHTGAPDGLRCWTRTAVLGALAFAPACSSPIRDADDCESRELAVAGFAAATVALEGVVGASVYEVQYDRGLTDSPNAVAEILAEAGLDPVVIGAAIDPGAAARAAEAEQAARGAFAAGDLEAAYLAADVMLAGVLDAVEAVAGKEARDAVRPRLGALFRGRNTPSEVSELRAVADSALREAVYRAALAVYQPVHGAGGRTIQLESKADSAMREALDAAIRSALECVE